MNFKHVCYPALACTHPHWHRQNALSSWRRWSFNINMYAIRINVRALGNSSFSLRRSSAVAFVECVSMSLSLCVSASTEWKMARTKFRVGSGEFMTHTHNFYTYLMPGTWQHFRLQFLHTNMWIWPICSRTNNWNSFLMRGNVASDLKYSHFKMASFLLSALPFFYPFGTSESSMRSEEKKKRIRKYSAMKTERKTSWGN